MTQQNKHHPFDTALMALSPVFAPSFFLRSPRDRENKVKKYPLIDYIILSGGSRVYNPSKNQWRISIDVQLDILIQESRPLSWCDFDELKDAQDRHALQNRFDEMTNQFLTLLINPQRIDSRLKESDFIYYKYDFALEAFIAARYWQKYGVDKLTGVSSQFTISYISPDSSGCCLIDGSNDQWSRIQALTVPDSVTYRAIENIINP